ILIDILKHNKNYFISSYQICIFLKSEHENIWNDIENEYGTMEDKPDIGAGAGQTYTPSQYIAKALDFLTKKHPEITKELMISTDITYKNFEPGFTRKKMAIWAWKE
ncbi:hypothetical protein, partial [Proteus faecis]